MVVASFLLTFSFFVSTFFSLSVLAVGLEGANVVLIDNSISKGISLCIDNQFVTPVNNQYSVSAGRVDIKGFYGDIESGLGCDNQYIQFKKVFEEVRDFKPGQTFTITATGKSDLVGLIKHNKAILLSQTDIVNSKQNGSTISWSSVTEPDVKNKNAICVNKKIIKEDKQGSKQIVVDPGYYKVSFDYDQSGELCNPILPDSEGDTLILDIGCNCSAKYEISTQKNDDYAKAKYQGLNFATNIVDKAEVILPPVKPLPVVTKPIAPETPIKPIISTKPAPEIKPSTSTVRSGGGDNILSITMILLFAGLSFGVSKRKNLKWV
jgi:hypothetical protein